MCLLNPSETNLILLNPPPSLLPPILVRQKMGLTWDSLGTHLGLNADGIVIASNLTVLTVYSYRISTPTRPHPKV